MPQKRFIYLFLFLMIAVNVAHAQNPIKIVMQSGSLMHSRAIGENIFRAVNSPVFEHDGAILTCDSAWINDATNSVDCFGNVAVKMSDTLNLYGDVIHYDGNTRIANVNKNVRLVDRATTLTTDLLLYDRNTGVASYNTGGYIVNGDNTLKSKKGYYYTGIKTMYFRDDVELTNPDYKITCDTLKYNTQTEISYFLSPTHIKGKKNYIYCEDGEYNSLAKTSRFSKNAYLLDANHKFSGDTLFYDEQKKMGTAVRNIEMTDTTQNLRVKGNYAEYWQNKGYAIVTQKAVAMIADKKEPDTLYLHAKLLKAIFDTATNKGKELYAYTNAKFFKTDLQGACDSLYYNFSDSLMYMYRNPVIWSDKSQITADTIKALTGHGSVKQMFMNANAFIVSKDSLDSYNQIKGREMVGYFKNNKPDYVDVNGNAESVYFVREDNKDLVGIKKTVASKMKIYIKNSKIDRMLYSDKTVGQMYPEKDFPKDSRMLKGFAWRDSDRPANKDDIYGIGE